MTEQEIKEAIRALEKASEVISNLPSDFKCPRGLINLDYTLDEVIEELKNGN